MGEMPEEPERKGRKAATSLLHAAQWPWGRPLIRRMAAWHLHARCFRRVFIEAVSLAGLAGDVSASIEINAAFPSRQREHPPPVLRAVHLGSRKRLRR